MVGLVPLRGTRPPYRLNLPLFQVPLDGHGERLGFGTLVGQPERPGQHLGNVVVQRGGGLEVEVPKLPPARTPSSSNT